MKQAVGSLLWNIGGTCGVDVGAKGECRRLACINTSGAYLCNESLNPVSQSCRDIAKYVEILYDNCCPQGGISGRDRFDNYSIWVGYCSNDHSPTEVPWTFRYHDGNNPDCEGCGADDCTPP